MLVVWTFIKNAFSFLVKNWGWIVTVLMVLFMFLFFRQCGETKIAKAETAETKRIADNNLKAMKDSTIVLKMTREQLALTDNNLSKLVKKYDSLQKHPKIVIIVKPEYIPKVVITDNSLVRDSADSSKYGLKFRSIDPVRTIGATSWFHLYNTDNVLEIKPNQTYINEFSLNFGLSIAKYEDQPNKMTRLTIEPYMVDEDGNFTDPVPPGYLKLSYRGVDLLDVPYVDPESSVIPKPKGKYSLRSGFSASINLVSIGYTPFTTPTAMNWVMPSIGIGYSFVLIRNK